MNSGLMMFNNYKAIFLSVVLAVLLSGCDHKPSMMMSCDGGNQKTVKGSFVYSPDRMVVSVIFDDVTIQFDGANSNNEKICTLSLSIPVEKNKMGYKVKNDIRGVLIKSKNSNFEMFFRSEEENIKVDIDPAEEEFNKSFNSSIAFGDDYNANYVVTVRQEPSGFESGTFFQLDSLDIAFKTKLASP